MLKFDAKQHAYKLDGKPMTGVTTILGVIAKPALINWSANMAVSYIKANLNKGIKTGNWEKIFAEARVAHTKKKENAGDVGTLAHKWIEAYIKGEKKPITKEIKPMIDNFLRWEDEVKPKFLESEMRVYSRKYWFAGTLDLILEIDGEIWIGDIKTSSGIYPEQFYQTAGYQIALQEMGLYPNIKGHIIINLKKDGTMKIKKSCEYEEDRKAFLGALAIYRRKQSLTDN